jgi:DNA-binding SARP family transcriptional activator
VLRSREALVWKIRTLGTLQISYDNRPFGTRFSENSKALIAYLAVQNGKNVRRGEITNAIWNRDYCKKDQHRLSTMIWRLNNLPAAKDHHETKLVQVDSNGALRIEANGFTWLDIVQFDSASQKTCNTIVPSEIEGLINAVELYNGDLLQDFDFDWLLEIRQYYRQCYIDLLQVLTEYFDRERDFNRVLYCADRLMKVDPYLEPIHALAIKACLATGRRALAVARAEACRRLLVEELGINLAPDTRQLLTALLSRCRLEQPQGGSATKGAALKKRPDPDPNRLRQLRQTLSQVVTVCSALLSELQQIDR